MRNLNYNSYPREAHTCTIVPPIRDHTCNAPLVSINVKVRRWGKEAGKRQDV